MPEPAPVSAAARCLAQSLPVRPRRADPHVQPRAAGKFDQCVQAEQFRVALAQVRSPRARDAEAFPEFCCPQVSVFDMRDDRFQQISKSSFPNTSKTCVLSKPNNSPLLRRPMPPSTHCWRTFFHHRNRVAIPPQKYEVGAMQFYCNQLIINK